ncbi:MAG TPA: RNA 2',3'-cyclic phosphodiesterase [Burkholderiaceae bacterium]|jgi:2'-5' RNA ligase
MAAVQGETGMANSIKQSLRLFYALWPDDAARAALMRLQVPISGRKTRYENFHLTLPFLGQQAADLLPLFKSILADISSPPITLMVNRIGYFTQKKIAWAGMNETPAALTALNDKLIEALRRNNIVFNNQSAFRPHITLARDAEPPEELPFDPFVWHCEHAALIESTNQEEGVVYRVLASHHLGQSEGIAADSATVIASNQNIITETD